MRLEKEDEFDELMDIDNVASTTECTGLMPTPPASPEQAQAYTDIYAIPQPNDKTEHGLQKEQGVNNPQ